MENSRKEPLIRIEKRSERPHGQIIRLRLLSVLLAIVLTILPFVIAL